MSAHLLRHIDHIVMLTAYFDESSSHLEAEVFVLAGLVSTVKQWRRLEAGWQRVLAREGLDDYHAVDCAHGTEAFKSWSRERRGAIHRQLVGLIKKHVCWCTWTAIIRKEYIQFFRDEHHKAMDDLQYTLCATGCASLLLPLATGRDERVVLVFERGGRGGARAAAMLHNVIDDGLADLYRLDRISLVKRKGTPALQAADLHAYEVGKYFADQMERKQFRLRKSFRELMTIREAGGGGFLFNAEKMRHWVEGLKQGHLVQIGVDKLNNEELVRIEPLEEGEIVYLNPPFGSLND